MVKAIKRAHRKYIFLVGKLLRLTQRFPLQEGQVCIHLARQANKGDGWLRKNLKRI